jgi:hypothetical protein
MASKGKGTLVAVRERQGKTEKGLAGHNRDAGLCEEVSS